MDDRHEASQANPGVPLENGTSALGHPLISCVALDRPDVPELIPIAR